MKRSRIACLNLVSKFFFYFSNLGFGKYLSSGKISAARRLRIGQFQILHTQFTFYPNMATSNPTHSHKTILCTYICSDIQIQSIFLHNILTNSTCTMSGQTLLCSSVLRTCTWKIVFKIENNELNELSECMLL